jgi:hypothetical protein
MRRFLFAAATIGCLPLVAACTQSVENAARDVDRAHDQAVRNVDEEQRDLEDVKQDSAERIARQERRVEDAKRAGQEQVVEEQRELEDAKREEARREDARREDLRRDDTITPIPPTPEERAAVDRPARLDVDVNRTPGGGVNVEVNPKR